MNISFRRRLMLGAGALSAPLLIVACGGVEGAGGSEVDLQFSSFLGPTTPQGQAMDTMWSALSDGDSGISVEPFWEGALLGADETLSGVSQGRADIGYMTIQYNPGELPLTQAVTVPFQTNDFWATGEAYNDLYENNEAFREEWERHGVHVLTFTPTPPSIFATAEPMPDYASMAGHQIRATGLTANAVDAAGANAVALEVGEIYESIQRGLIDGYTTMLLDTVPSTSLDEVAPHVYDTGIGAYTMNVILINADTWESLSDDQRTAVEGAVDQYTEDYASTLAEVEDGACEDLIANGGGVEIWSEEDQQQWRDDVGTLAYDRFITSATDAGADPAPFFDEYVELLDTHASDTETGMERCAAR